MLTLRWFYFPLGWFTATWKKEPIDRFSLPGLRYLAYMDGRRARLKRLLLRQ